MTPTHKRLAEISARLYENEVALLRLDYKYVTYSDPIQRDIAQLLHSLEVAMLALEKTGCEYDHKKSRETLAKIARIMGGG